MKTFAASCLLFLSLVCHVCGAAGGVTSPSDGGSGYQVTIKPGANLSTYAWRSDTSYFLKKGAPYRLTPTLLVTNVLTGTTMGGIKWLSLSNITLTIEPGAIISGTNAYGELLFASNCLNAKIDGGTWWGKTNHNHTELATSNGIWGAICYANCDGFTVENALIERHADHGIVDAASGILNGMRNSTNVFIRWNRLRDIGGWRTNHLGGVSFDGTAIVPTEGIVEFNDIKGVFRGIEPYNAAPGSDARFKTIVRFNSIRNVAAEGIVTFGTTNIWNSELIGNHVVNDPVFIYHGTNYGGVFASGAAGITISGGSRWRMTGNTVEGQFLYGYALFNGGASKFDDLIFSHNTAFDINNSGSQGYGFYFGNPVNTAEAATSFRRGLISYNKAFRTMDCGFALWTGRDVKVIGNEVYNCNLANVGLTFGASMLIGYPGFSNAGLTNILAMDNTVHVDVAGPTYGVLLADNIRSMRWENNDVRTNGLGGGLRNGGITNQAGYNVAVRGPRINGVVNFDLPSIAAGGQFVTNAAFVGATTNTALRIEMNLTALTSVSSNLVATARGSNGNVIVTFRNTGAAAADAPQENYFVEGYDTRIAGQ
jgi:hypothetical protein